MRIHSAHHHSDELAGLVGAYMANIQQFQKFLGTPVQTGKFWLMVDFPDGPPPEYERAGYVYPLVCT